MDTENAPWCKIIRIDVSRFPKLLQLTRTGEQTSCHSNAFKRGDVPARWLARLPALEKLAARLLGEYPEDSGPEDDQEANLYYFYDYGDNESCAEELHRVFSGLGDDVAVLWDFWHDAVEEWTVSGDLVGDDYTLLVPPRRAVEEFPTTVGQLREVLNLLPDDTPLTCPEEDLFLDIIRVGNFVHVTVHSHVHDQDEHAEETAEEVLLSPALPNYECCADTDDPVGAL